MTQSTLVLVLDLIGIAAFATAGALAGMEKGLDLFGVIVTAAVTGLGGGVLRDVLLGATPPASFTDWRYLVAPVPAAVVVFFRSARIARQHRALLVLDAIGLGLFAVGGTEKALRFGLGSLAAIGLGVITSVGGGAIRDVLLGEIPVILRREVYATAALLGGVIVVVGSGWHVARTPVAVGAVVAVALTRLVSLRRGWNVVTAAPARHV